jgi:CheY-like chemotaxis protein
MHRLLVIEDDPDQADLVIEILNQRLGKDKVEATTISAGDEAIAFLSSEYRCRSPHLPHLVLLDLHLPVHGGMDVLKFIKSHRNLRRIPVVVLSATADVSEINRCYDYFANSFVSKTSNRVLTLSSISNYWLNTSHPAQVY